VFEIDKQVAWNIDKDLRIEELKRLSSQDQKTLRVYDLVNKVANDDR